MYSRLQYLFAVIAVVITPTVSMLTYYAFTGDPSLRPLAASLDQIRGFFAGRNDILIEVQWGEFARAGSSKNDVKKALQSAFRSKGLDAYVVIHDVKGGQNIRVTYRVGASEFGPMRLADTPHAVQSVADAYRMGERS